LQFDALVDEMIMRDVSDVLQEITKKRNGFMKRFPSMNQKKGLIIICTLRQATESIPTFFLDGFILLNKNQLKSDFPSHSWQVC